MFIYFNSQKVEQELLKEWDTQAGGRVQDTPQPCISPMGVCVESNTPSANRYCSLLFQIQLEQHAWYEKCCLS